MERKIYEAPETEVFVIGLSHMCAATGGPVTQTAGNVFDSDVKAGTVEARSKERGGDDFDWDLGF